MKTFYITALVFSVLAAPDPGHGQGPDPSSSGNGLAAVADAHSEPNGVLASGAPNPEAASD